MKIIRPVKVDVNNLTSSNIAENEHPDWSPGQTYNDGDRVIHENNVYEYIDAPNRDVNSPPDQSPNHWVLVGATNRFKMFDGIVDSQSQNADLIEVSVTPGAVVNSVAFFGLSGSQINVQVDDPIDGVVYDETRQLQDNTNITDFYNYFFEPIIERTDLVLTDLPAYGTAEIKVRLEKTDNVAKLGEFVLGIQQDLGVTNFGSTSVSIEDYSRRDRDQFGQTIIVPRRFSKRADFDVTVETNRVAQVQRALSDIRTTPVVYIGEEDKEETIIYGFFRSFNIVLDTPSISSCTIQVEGLT